MMIDLNSLDYLYLAWLTHPDLQVVWIDKGGVDPASVDLTEVPAEAVKVTKVTERLLHQVEVRKAGRASRHEEENHQQLSPGARHHHWSSSRHLHHVHITVTKAPHGVTLGSWLAPLPPLLVSINCNTNNFTWHKVNKNISVSQKTGIAA